MREELSPDCYFIHLAHCVKMKSPDPKTKKGAVLASDDLKVKSTGYNDVPKEDNNILDWCDRDHLDYYLVSAEVNCILNADPLVEFETSTLYLTHSPRSHSIKTLAAAGIKKIIYDHCCGDIALVRDICNYFMIEIIKFRPKDKVLIGSTTF
jgi:dCMP deaminase